MSPSLSQVQQDIEQLELTPALKEHLAALLSTYNELKFDLETIKHQMDIEKLAIGSILNDAGIDKANIDGCPLTWVRDGVTTKLDKQILIAGGVTLKQLEDATVSKPKANYFRIGAESKRFD